MYVCLDCAPAHDLSIQLLIWLPKVYVTCDYCKKEKTCFYIHQDKDEFDKRIKKDGIAYAR